MKNQWVIKPNPADQITQVLMEEVKLPHPIAKILAQRGIDSFDSAKNFFRPDLTELHDPFLMKDMDNAVKRIAQAFENQENILVYGDYDVDGTTAVALMYDFLIHRYPNVSYYIPDRYSEGYGISFQGIDFAEDNDFSLIIALDCGIKAIDKIQYANEKQIDFIICDHHLPGDKLPEAIAVLDPKRSDCEYPFKELSGCGVGFKLIQALLHELDEDPEKAFDYLDLAVVSIAADIVPISGENRILAYYGLKKLQSSPRPGLESLIGEAQKDKLTISNIVFSIAPKINATGRLEHASQSVELLISEDKEKIATFASQINDLNTQRKETDGNVTVEAIQMIRKKGEEDRFSTVVYDPNWHKGVLGIVASRLIDTFYRPTLVLTQGNENEITGSARSVKDFDIYEIIDNCSELLTKYGGHRFAAGLTMPIENLEAFKEKFEELVKEKIRPIQRKPSIEIDAEIQFSEVTPYFIKVLNQMEPFGPENMTPIFLTKNLIGGEVKEMGKNKEHLRLSLWDENSAVKLPAVAFGMGEFSKDFQYRRFDAVYSIDENHWKGNTYLQLNLRDVRFKD
ncbi:single-stranded-DNA-specific exonuclease RecJ [Moheibacter lacus]|uniref:Single-stranded-DNA-specific exonuclease RecJ n=1 Tax=Moheibacter lacus TaxID=2745851 RepID=A0A838ZS84_9FLAO|nr:single-stranded-DNA-specific exonuclease RecJ [Moheibacter lacus]MBA5629099.1 single-stranded-DNA-specific exonuclease RecJ [Moheibacter lacus]